MCFLYSIILKGLIDIKRKFNYTIEELVFILGNVDINWGTNFNKKYNKCPYKARRLK